MSMGYRWAFEARVPKDQMEKVLKAFPYDVDGHDTQESNDGPWLVCWGEGSLGGGISLDERHEEVKRAVCGVVPEAVVVTRWRCTEFDVWDEEFGLEDET